MLYLLDHMDKGTPYSIFIGCFGIGDFAGFAEAMAFTATARCSGVRTSEAAETA